MAVAGYVLNPGAKQQMLAQLERIHSTADRRIGIARVIAMVVFVVMSGAVFAAIALMAGELTDSSRWARITLLIFGLITMLGFGLFLWRTAEQYRERVARARDEECNELLHDTTWVLPRSLLDDFYIADDVDDRDLWRAAEQIHTMRANWEHVAGLMQRRNLTLTQEFEVMRAEDAARAVIDNVGHLLNPAPAAETYR